MDDDETGPVQPPDLEIPEVTMTFEELAHGFIVKAFDKGLDGPSDMSRWVSTDEAGKAFGNYMFLTYKRMCSQSDKNEFLKRLTVEIGYPPSCKILGTVEKPVEKLVFFGLEWTVYGQGWKY